MQLGYRRLDYDELESLFDDFTSRVVRLENLDTYTTPHEAKRLARYLAGHDDEPPSDSTWNQQMAAHVAAGRQWAKVHVLRDPTAPYFRYAAEWSWTNSSSYGQDLRILDLTGRGAFCPPPGSLSRPLTIRWFVEEPGLGDRATRVALRAPVHGTQEIRFLYRRCQPRRCRPIGGSAMTRPIRWRLALAAAGAL